MEKHFNCDQMHMQNEIVMNVSSNLLVNKQISLFGLVKSWAAHNNQLKNPVFNSEKTIQYAKKKIEIQTGDDTQREERLYTGERKRPKEITFPAKDKNGTVSKTHNKLQRNKKK